MKTGKQEEVGGFTPGCCPLLPRGLQHIVHMCDVLGCVIHRQEDGTHDLCTLFCCICWIYPFCNHLPAGLAHRRGTSSSLLNHQHQQLLDVVLGLGGVLVRAHLKPPPSCLWGSFEDLAWKPCAWWGAWPIIDHLTIWRASTFRNSRRPPRFFLSALFSSMGPDDERIEASYVEDVAEHCHWPSSTLVLTPVEKMCTKKAGRQIDGQIRYREISKVGTQAFR